MPGRSRKRRSKPQSWMTASLLSLPSRRLCSNQPCGFPYLSRVLYSVRSWFLATTAVQLYSCWTFGIVSSKYISGVLPPQVLSTFRSLILSRCLWHQMLQLTPGLRLQLGIVIVHASPAWILMTLLLAQVCDEHDERKECLTRASSL